jgi:chromosome segregation ATPase
MDNAITRAEHEEFKKRIEDENKRQDKRIELLEENTKRLEVLNSSIEKLAINMESMLKEQMQQGKRLEVLESRDGEMWRKAVSYIATAIIGVVIGFIFKQFGM